MPNVAWVARGRAFGAQLEMKKVPAGAGSLSVPTPQRRAGLAAVRGWLAADPSLPAELPRSSVTAGGI